MMKLQRKYELKIITSWKNRHLWNAKDRSFFLAQCRSVRVYTWTYSAYRVVQWAFEAMRIALRSDQQCKCTWFQSQWNKNLQRLFRREVDSFQRDMLRCSVLLIHKLGRLFQLNNVLLRRIAQIALTHLPQKTYRAVGCLEMMRWRSSEELMPSLRAEIHLSCIRILRAFEE